MKKENHDYYETIGVERTADEETIKKAFRQLAMKHHPDKNPGDKDAEERFKKINEAYEVLSDSKKRQEYDEFGSVDRNTSGFHANMHHNPFGAGAYSFNSFIHNYNINSSGRPRSKTINKDI